MGTTPLYSLPYPEQSDPVDVAGDIAKAMQAVEAALKAIHDRTDYVQYTDVTTTVANWGGTIFASKVGSDVSLLISRTRQLATTDPANDYSVGTLPAQYRPNRTVYAALLQNQAPRGAEGRVTIEPSGDITFSGIDGPINTTYQATISYHVP